MGHPELINFQTLKINEEVEDKGTKKSHTKNNTKKKKLSSNLRMVYLCKLKKKIYIWNKEFIFRNRSFKFPRISR